MTLEQLKKQVQTLMMDRKLDGRDQIVEIETDKFIWRGYVQELRANGALVFQWIPELAKNVKSIKHLDMDVITIYLELRPDQIHSIKNLV